MAKVLTCTKGNDQYRNINLIVTSYFGKLATMKIKVWT